MNQPIEKKMMVLLTCTKSDNVKVRLLKALRSLTGLGLKEAVDYALPYHNDEPDGDGFEAQPIPVIMPDLTDPLYSLVQTGLAANDSGIVITRLLSKIERPGIYRVHPRPDDKVYRDDQGRAVIFAIEVFQIGEIRDGSDRELVWRTTSPGRRVLQSMPTLEITLGWYEYMGDALTG